MAWLWQPRALTGSLVGFGTFAVKNRAGRDGRNPRTGENDYSIALEPGEWDAIVYLDRVRPATAAIFPCGRVDRHRRVLTVPSSRKGTVPRESREAAHYTYFGALGNRPISICAAARLTAIYEPL